MSELNTNTTRQAPHDDDDDVGRALHETGDTRSSLTRRRTEGDEVDDVGDHNCKFVADIGARSPNSGSDEAAGAVVGSTAAHKRSPDSTDGAGDVVHRSHSLDSGDVAGDAVDGTGAQLVLVCGVMLLGPSLRMAQLRSLLLPLSAVAAVAVGRTAKVVYGPTVVTTYSLLLSRYRYGRRHFHPRCCQQPPLGEY